MPGTRVGRYLRRVREKKEMSLRDVENEIRRRRISPKVSNGHLSLIEQGNVKEPGPKTLHALASVLQIDYLDLMVKAGYVDKAVMEGRSAPAPAFKGAEAPPERSGF